MIKPWYKLRDNPVPTDKAVLDAIPEKVKRVGRRLFVEHRYEKPKVCYDQQIVGECKFDAIYDAVMAAEEIEDKDEAFWQILALLDNNGFYCCP